METLASTFIYRHTRIHIATARPTEFIDITDGLQRLVSESGIVTGFANVHSLHTTAGIVVNEHEPLLLADFATMLEGIAPDDGRYQHDDDGVRTVNVTPGERPNGHAHCRALLLPCSACLNVAGGRLVLGRWQRVFLAEQDGPRPREISVLMLGEGGQ
jgi:secondary thiamine-phosphate synthase enzyme